MSNKNPDFWRLNVIVTAELQTSAPKLHAFLQCFETKEHTLRLNEAKINSDIASNGYHFKSEGNHNYSQNNTAKLPALYKIFEIEERALRVNEAKIKIENFFSCRSF